MLLKTYAGRAHRARITHSAPDWLTLTTKATGADETLWQLGERVLQAREREGEFPARWHHHGYSGWAVDHCALGSRADGSYLRLSGLEAANQWREALTACDNCTRIDLAVDVQLEHPVRTLARDLYRDAAHVPSGSGRPPKRSLYVSSDGGATAYFGSRTSEQFGRAYDKGIEDKTHDSGCRWRFELEAKDGAASAVAAGLVAASVGAEWTHRAVATFFRKRCGVALGRFHGASICNGNREVPEAERLLHWLAVGVRPTVARLVDYYGRQRVLCALGLLPNSAVDGAGPSEFSQ